MTSRNDDNNWLDSRAVTRDFDRAAGTYDKVAVLQRAVLERLFERLDVIRLKPERILDLGSGSGAAAAGLARRYRRAQVIQLDIAHGMLRHARRRAPRWFSRQRFVQADVAQLPIAPASIDFVFSSLMLQWVADLPGVFAQLRRSLRADGLIQFASFGPDTLKELRASWAAVDDSPHVNPFVDMHNVGDALVQVGFSDPVMEADTFHLTYSDVHALMRELKQLGAQNGLSDRRRSLTGVQRLRAMVDAYNAAWRQSDGRIPASFEVVYGHAWVPAQPPQQRTADGDVHVPLTSLKKRAER
ncbi:malonyl-CoA O-methyltransferase [Methylohalomonas lacus]|uniref:Malonyl-[acyl-carrier protein] O-methyltransferase n=1 Tax=Methylohalomonas lacus TaxID=398773 RepID=A0AAE3HLR8_9GAMM|nr:malonyl-ACP O-methyltransferase BioC [Methylohalomonas lacus]MCS3903322.1 malonyl-CoA O-methyltransferase [Methylohalomonas lacus]